MASESGAGGRESVRRLLDAVRPGAPDEATPKRSITRFRAPGVDRLGLGEALSRWYVSQGLQSDASVVGDAVVVRCRSAGGRGLVGASRGLTVVLRQDGLDLAVETGAGKWSDKAWVAGAGVLLLTSGGLGLIPLAASAVGSWRQWRLPAETLEYLRATAPSFAGGSPSGQSPGTTRQPPGTTSRPQAPAGTPPATENSTATLDVNSADVESLALVLGLNAAVAEDLVAVRAKLGGFGSWDQVREVLTRHLPPHRLAQVRDRIVIHPSRSAEVPRNPKGRGPLDL